MYLTITIITLARRLIHGSNRMEIIFHISINLAFKLQCPERTVNVRRKPTNKKIMQIISLGMKLNTRTLLQYKYEHYANPLG